MAKPINISSSLKAFLTNRKGKFELKYKKFYSINSILLHYLKGNPLFVDDYIRYCKNNNIEADIIANKEIDFNKIMKYYGEDNISLLYGKRL